MKSRSSKQYIQSSRPPQTRRANLCPQTLPRGRRKNEFGITPPQTLHHLRDANGKPVFLSSHVPIDFNVSLQAGIISLVAAVRFPGNIQVGTYVVCVNEREQQDKRHIEKEGFEDWIDMHRDVFAVSEVVYMKSGILKVEEKLRRFYAMWCLRETYVKMTGEALLAPWLRDLEIKGVLVVSEAGPFTRDDNSLECGDVETDFDIFSKKTSVTDVRIELTALGKHYMVGNAIRSDDLGKVPTAQWEDLDLENILDFTESH